MTDIWPTIHGERHALADELATLTIEQWQTPSWCEGWTVHDVLAHLTSAAKMTPPKFASRFAMAGFNFDNFAARQVAREGSGGPSATLAEFRKVLFRKSAPPGPKDTWLGEAFAHGEDIRRPLGLEHSYPLPYVTRVISLYANSNAIIGGKRRVSGLTLRATDTDFSLGTGPVVEGPAVDLMLAASGRKRALANLTGAGVETLAARS
jgi:uncharacterized protein (TIGR03083 family)